MAARSVVRLLHLGFTVAAYSLRYLLLHPFSRGRAALFGRVLAACLESCGPTFVKIGQILSSRYDLFEPDTIVELRRLQDNVRPLPPVLVFEEARRELGGDLAVAFATVEDEPLASGSVAQVHRARTWDGRDVVLKVQRPGIESLVDADIAAMTWIARVLERSGIAGTVPVSAVVAELGAAVRMQLDFTAEAEHSYRFRENLGHLETLTIPAVIPELSTRRVLVMEYMDELVRVERLHLSSEEREAAGVAGLQLLYHMIFIDGFVHADLHPGNVFFQRGPHVVLLDLGLVATLDRYVRKGFVDFFYALVTGDGAECARVVWETAMWRKPGCNRAQFEKWMEDIVGRHASLPACDFEVSRFVMDVFDAQRRAGIRGATSFVMTILSLLTFEGVVKTLSPHLDFQGEARHFLPAAKAMLYPLRPWTTS
jgi:ubiquinone biosynthesis protein